MPHSHGEDPEAREAGDLPEGEETLTRGAPLCGTSTPVVLTPLRRWVSCWGGGHDIGHGVAVESRGLTLVPSHLPRSSAYSALHTP